MRRRLSELLETLLARIRDWYHDDTAEAPTAAGRSDGSAADTRSDDRNLTSSEQQVVGILESQDGPVWQSALVEATGWSKSTISRSLSDLEDAGVIVRSRIGRRKVVFLAGDEPAVVDPPRPATPDQPPTPGPDEAMTAGPGDDAGRRADEPGEPTLDD